LVALPYLRLNTDDASRIPLAPIGKPVPNFNLPVMASPQERKSEASVTFTLSDADLRQGRVSIVTIFASWCVPCHHQNHLLMRLARDKKLAAKGVRLFGIAYKDDVANTLRFIEEEGNPYAVIGNDRRGRTAVDWGISGVPETFVVKGDGTIGY